MTVWVIRLPSTEHCDLESREVYYPCVPHTYVVTTYITPRVSVYRFTQNPYTKATHSYRTEGGGINTPVQRYITIGRIRAMVVKREAMLGQRRFGGDPDPTAFGTKNSQERLPVKLVANRRSEGIDEQ